MVYYCRGCGLELQPLVHTERVRVPQPAILDAARPQFRTETRLVPPPILCRGCEPPPPAPPRGYKSAEEVIAAFYGIGPRPAHVLPQVPPSRVYESAEDMAADFYGLERRPAHAPPEVEQPDAHNPGGGPFRWVVAAVGLLLMCLALVVILALIAEAP